MFAIGFYKRAGLLYKTENVRLTKAFTRVFQHLERGGGCPVLDALQGHGQQVEGEKKQP